jgi:hypothetical protein
MLKNGATTFYEDWDGSASDLHNAYLYAGSWFMEGLAGIRQPDAGYKHFVIEPWVDQRQGPQRVRAHYDSPYGRIATGWRIENGALHLEVTVPPNADANLRLHQVKGSSIQEGARPLGRAKGVVLESETGDVATLRLEAGHYEFTAPMNPVP